MKHYLSKNNSILILFLLIFFVEVSAQNNNGQRNNVNIYLKLANEKLESKDYKGAIEDCEVAELLCPNCTSPHYQKMIIYATEKKFSLAESELKKAYKLDKLSKDYIKYSILLQYNQGYTYEAYAALQKEIDKDSINVTANIWYHIRAGLYRSEKKYKLAYQDNCRIYYLNPNFLDILPQIIIHEIYTNQLEKAKEHFKEYRFTESNRDSMNTYYNMGQINCLLKDYRKANEYFDCCLKLKNNSSKILINKALALAYENKFDSAITYANKAVAAKNSNSFTLNNRGFIYILAAKYDSAIIDLEKSIELYDKDSQPFNNLAYIFSKTDKKKAKEYQQKAAKIGGEEYIPYWKIDIE